MKYWASPEVGVAKASSHFSGKQIFDLAKKTSTILQMYPYLTGFITAGHHMNVIFNSKPVGCQWCKIEKISKWKWFSKFHPDPTDNWIWIMHTILHNLTAKVATMVCDPNIRNCYLLLTGNPYMHVCRNWATALLFFLSLWATHWWDDTIRYMYELKPLRHQSD